MLPTGAVLLMAASALVQGAVVIDRIAIIAGNSIIKDSDIERDIRITGFLNHDALQFSDATRKEAASRLIDQSLIRREIQVSQHPYASDQNVNQFLDQIFGGRSARRDRNFVHAFQPLRPDFAQIVNQM